MQTARTLPEGQYRFLIGGGYFRTSETSPSDPSRVTYPYLEAGARFGFIENWDLGLRFTLPGMFTGDVKAQFLSTDTWAMAAGFGVGYMAVKEDKTAGTTSNLFPNEMLDLFLPVYLSYDFSRWVGLYVSPRLVFRKVDREMFLFGTAFGARFGNKVGVFIELSGASDFKSNYSQGQVGFGIFFGSPDSVPLSATRNQDDAAG